MKYENIIKKLRSNSVRVYEGEFDYKQVTMVSGTALIDLIDGKAVPTSAKYNDVVKQIQEGKSHIMTIEGGKKCLTQYDKL
ncbi:hypothetical protein [Niameybacter massiliensis]|uniref:hypothetical protein n=1 Tax=Niameybacter massiliensis TaxID=1658108 RepID=UPI0006B5CEC9|nr:hypothetical protein [Niameybacter massiliensis]